MGGAEICFVGGGAISIVSPCLVLFVLLGACGGPKVVEDTVHVGDEESGDTARPDETASDDTDSGHTGADDTVVVDTDACLALTARASVNRSSGRIPFEASLDASASCGPEPIASWQWEVDGELLDGAAAVWEGLSAGTFEARLTVTDTLGDTDTDAVTLEVLPQECPEVLDAVALGALADTALVEASDLLVSRRDPEVLWSHNDSGDTPRLFALGRDGAALGTWTLDVEDGDWEDLAWGTDPDSGEPLIFIGDTGNNGTSRTSLLVYVIEEPEVDTSAEATEHAVESYKTLTLDLPEVLNVDAMLVDPVTGDLLLLSDAEDGRSVLLRKAAPHLDGEEVALEEVAELAFGAGDLPGDTLATSADISPLGERVVVRTRDEAWLWLRDGAATVAETLLTAPCPVALPTETLGEAVAFDIRDGGLLTTSEGAGSPLYWVPFVEEPECIDTLEAVITATPPGGPLPIEVVFDASASCVPEGLAEVRWMVDGELKLGETVSASWLASGSYPVLLTITDTLGNEASASATIVVEPGDCPTEDSAEILGTIADDELVEISGVAVSRRDTGVLWVHNDSGDSPRLFAINRTGETLGTWTLDVDKGDFEDMAAGFAEDGTPELWVGDIGDNGKEKTEIHLYRVDEPEIPAGDAEDHTVTEVDTITLTYPDGARNCETLLLDPVTRDFYLVTKDYGGDSEVYRKAAPHVDGEVAVLEYIASLTFGVGDLAGNMATTGGEFSPDGAWIVVRTYGETAFVWRRDGSGTVADAFGTTPCPITLPYEAQGEAICFDVDSEALISISEREYQPIHWTTLVR